MLSSLLPSSSSIHVAPMRPSFHRRPASQNPILSPLLASKLHLGGRSTLSGRRAEMPELARFAALESGEGMEEDDGGLGEAEAIIRNGPSNLRVGFSWRNVESVLNRMSKWLVAGLFGLAILWKHDAEVLWAATGSVINSWLSITLKRILNHERPVSGLRSDPGMPSSHAQSIFYIAAIAILSMIHWLGISPLTVTVGIITFMFGSYLSWLRVSQRLHTPSQVLVGALLGSICGIVWFWMWHSFVLRAFIAHVWVRILVVLGSITFCVVFVVYVIQHWLRDEP